MVYGVSMVCEGFFAALNLELSEMKSLVYRYQAIKACCITAIVMLTFAGCATAVNFLPTTGQVIEEGTNKPLTGVTVVAHWLGTVSGFGGHGGTVCRHVETATTDDQGRYRLSLWEDRGPTVVYSYKAGYQESEGSGKVRTVERVVAVLRAIPPLNKARMLDLERVVRVTACPEAGASRRALSKVYERISKEAEPLASTIQDRETLAWMERQAAYAATAVDHALTQREADRLADQYLKEKPQ